MKFLLPLALTLFATIATAQQRQSYVYTRLNDSTRRFKSEEYEILFHDYKKATKNLKEKRVVANKEAYLIAVNDSKVGMVQSIYDPAGTPVATVFLGASNTNDIVSGLLNLKWKSIDTDDWIYTINGEEVARCSYHISDTVERVDMTFDSNIPFVVQLACLDKSLANIKSKDHTGKEGKVYFGIKGGANLSILSASINSESQFRSSWNLGIYLKVPIGKNSFFRPEIFYSSQGQKDNYTYNTGLDAGKTTTTLNYLNIPLLLEFGKTITVQTGFQAGILLSAREEGQITNQPIDDDLKEIMNPVDMSLVVGVGANVSRKINLGVRYNLGLTNIFKETYQPYPGLDFPVVKNRVFHFFVGFSF